MADEEEWDEIGDAESESSDGESAARAVPEGHRVVRDTGRKRGTTSRETVYLKRREVIRDMSEEDTAPVGVRQQVERLKEAKKKQQAPLEDRWGSRRHRRRGARWVILVVLAVGAPVVALMVGISLLKKPPGESTTYRTKVLDLDDPGVIHFPYDSASPGAWFHDNSVEAFDDAVAILERCNKAGDPRELVDVLRDGERTLGKMKERGAGWDVPFFLSDPREITWEYGEAGETGFMAVAGRRKDHTPFRAYFVKTDDGLMLDWDATEAWSQIPLQELVEKAPKHPTLVRAWLAKQPDYDADVGRGSLYSWYLVLGQRKENFVWAYAPAGSQIDQDIKSLLNYGRFVMERKDEARAILRLVKPTLGFRETEFEIVELVTGEWVMP